MSINSINSISLSSGNGNQCVGAVNIDSTFVYGAKNNILMKCFDILSYRNASSIKTFVVIYCVDDTLLRISATINFFVITFETLINP